MLQAEPTMQSATCAGGHPCWANHCTEQALSKGRAPALSDLPHTFREGAELAVVVDLGDPEGVGVCVRVKVSSRGLELQMHVVRAQGFTVQAEQQLAAAERCRAS